GLRREDIHGWGKLAPGTWRDLMVRPDCLDVTQKETGTLTLEFTLPSGSYATEVLRELTHCRAPACVTPASSLSSARDAPSGRIPRR
ncbi:MAG TPA: tRNA pseudouridine(13) synthase TruD, partial [Polyangiaceae bacterium]